MANRLGRLVGRTVAVVGYPYRLVRRVVGRRRERGAPLVVSAAVELAAEDGLSRLATALSDPDPATRTLALDVICEFSAERAARLISSMLHDPNPGVRSAAAAAAERLGATGTVFSLILALDDAEAEVRAAARDAIEAITGRHVELAADSDAGQRRRAMDELKHWWKGQRVAELEHELDL